MDEHMVLLHGRAVTFEHDFSDHNLNDLSFFTDKHNKYATREAIDVLLKRYDLRCAEGVLTAKSASLERPRNAGSKSGSIIFCRSGSVRLATSSIAIFSNLGFSMAARAHLIISCRASGIASLSAPRCSSSTAR